MCREEREGGKSNKKKNGGGVVVILPPFLIPLGCGAYIKGGRKGGGECLIDVLLSHSLFTPLPAPLFLASTLFALLFLQF